MLLGGKGLELLLGLLTFSIWGDLLSLDLLTLGPDSERMSLGREPPESSLPVVDVGFWPLAVSVALPSLTMLTLESDSERTNGGRELPASGLSVGLDPWASAT